MGSYEFSRRDFIRSSSLMAASAVTGVLAGGAQAQDTNKKEVDTSKILNYNPQMGYRRLGKTNLMTSEVSLGGHWKNRNAGRYWGEFANDEVPEDVVKNRTEVISACIDAGINYLDITTPAECLSYGVALKGRREKMCIGADDYGLCPRNPKFRNAKDQIHNVEECLRRLQTDYLDIWRPQMMMDGSNTDAEVEEVIKAYDELHQDGKALHFGMSTHNRYWAQHVIQKYPQVEMFIFPCTAVTKEKGKPATKDNVEESNPGYGSDVSQSIFQTVREKDVGLVTIKPFMGGNLFESCGKDKFPVLGVGVKKENDIARLTLQCILTNDAITATVPGLSTIYEVDNAARASYSRSLAMSPAERQWLAEETQKHWVNLPLEYSWLRDWQVV